MADLIVKRASCRRSHLSYYLQMLSYLVQCAFEWFVTVIWDKYGPFAGVISAMAGLAAIIGTVAFALQHV